MTVRETIRHEIPNLTQSERKVANAVMADYPFSGIQTIQELAARTGVSAPSITRFVAKLGFAGYQEFQRQLIGELRAGRRSPLDLKVTEKLGGDDFLSIYARRTSELLADMTAAVSKEQFELIVGLLADPARDVFVLGGRMSDTIASLLSFHLRQIRPGVRHLPANPEHWPDHVLSMRKRDVFVLFDFRRYQPDLAKLAGIVAARRGAKVVLITDRWMSPVAHHSDHVIALPTENDTAWDSSACVLALVEALIVKVSQSDWPKTRLRIEAWDSVRLMPPISRDGDTDEA